MGAGSINYNYYNPTIKEPFKKEELKTSRFRKRTFRTAREGDFCRYQRYNKKYVIKYGLDVDDPTYSGPSCLDDYLKGQINKEIKFWKDIVEEKDRQYFAPILWYKTNKWIVQPNCRFKRYNQIERAIYKSTINNLIDKYGLWDLEFNSCESRNCGILWNGKPIIYDYGSYNN